MTIGVKKIEPGCVIIFLLETRRKNITKSKLPFLFKNGEIYLPWEVSAAIMQYACKNTGDKMFVSGKLHLINEVFLIQQVEELRQVYEKYEKKDSDADGDIHMFKKPPRQEKLGGVCYL